MTDEMPTMTMRRLQQAAADAGEPVTPRTLAATTGIPINTVRHYVRRMESAGLITRVAHGWYEATDPTKTDTNERNER